MGDNGNLHIGEIKKQKEDLNKTGGINTSKAIFDTSGGNTEEQNPYAVSRVENLANNGPLMATRIHTQNPNDIAFERAMKIEAGGVHGQAKKVKSMEGLDMIRAQPDLRVFSGEVMKKGAFTPKAKEAARHFFKQVTDWAGSFDDGGSGFYGSMGISSVLDCLYIDGMNIRRYLNEQYYYKTTGKPAQDMESMRNYLALIAARGDHIITLVRPTVKPDGAEVEYRNLYVNLDNVGSDEATKSKKLREKGNQVRSTLKKRIDDDITERTGMAYRKAYGMEMEGLTRAEGAKGGIKNNTDENSEEFKNFEKSFDRYNNGLQKLGLKPGRDDINLPVAEELRKRCEDAIKLADDYLASNSKNEKAVKAVEKAKEVLEADKKRLDEAVTTKLNEEGARMRLSELFSGDDGKDPKGSKGAKDGKGQNDDNSADDDQDGGNE